MIIKYPTGLYRDVLPSKPEDSSSVTFTISNTTPPRTNLIFPKIPVGLVDRGRIRPPAIDKVLNRQYLGDLIFSISSAKRNDAGNSSRQFEIGQVLEFETTGSQAVEPMMVSPITEIQHNTNTFDYDALGMSAADQAVIAEQSIRTHITLTTQLNDLKTKRADAETQINTKQKLINETNRTISALVVIATTSAEVADLIKKLEKTRDTAFSERDAAVADANLYAAQADEALTKLRAVALVLK